MNISSAFHFFKVNPHFFDDLTIENEKFWFPPHSTTASFMDIVRIFSDFLGGTEILVWELPIFCPRPPHSDLRT